jgi:uncharacterized GH25 family protein
MSLKSKLSGAGAAALLIFGGTGSAAAHVAYMEPSVFVTTQADIVTIETSFAEDFMFRPEIVVTSDDFHVVRPDGQRAPYARIENFTQLTLLEAGLDEPGTYRFTTGERLGRTSTYVLTDGEWRPIAPGETAPAGAPVRQSQTATVSDVYVTKGAPTDASRNVTIGRLAIVPVTHPNAIYRDEGAVFEIRFDGKPMAGQELEVDRQGGDYEEPRYSQVVKTDASGRVTLNFDQAGVYLIHTRHRADAPPGSATPMRGYTTSLTFEVSP